MGRIQFIVYIMKFDNIEIIFLLIRVENLIVIKELFDNYKYLDQLFVLFFNVNQIRYLIEDILLYKVIVIYGISFFLLKFVVLVIYLFFFIVSLLRFVIFVSSGGIEFC